jgi:serine protease DegQ
MSRAGRGEGGAGPWEVAAVSSGRDDARPLHRDDDPAMGAVRSTRQLIRVLAACAATIGLAGCTGDAEPTVAATATTTGYPDIPAIVRTVGPSVVTVLTAQGSGSGIVYRAGGIVITNEHVVQGSTNVTLALADGSRVPAAVKATDPVTDVAVLQAGRTDLPPATFVTALPAAGAPAIVLGSPLGFNDSVTSGVISGLHRQIPGSAQERQSLVDLIQTDAPISPGNSGGALVDGAGRVVGMSEAYIPPSAGAVALGFAIPAATVVHAADNLLATGRVPHAYLGLQPADLTADIAGRLGLGSTTAGAAVLSIAPGGPAATAGLRPGDVITSVDGTPVESAEDLLAILRSMRPGDTATVQVARDGDTKTLQVRVGDRPPGSD